MFSQRSDCTGMGIGLLQLHSTKSHIYPGGFMYWTVEINFKAKYLQNIRKYLPMPDWVRIRWPVTRGRVSLHHGIALLGPPLDAETMQFRLILDIIFTHSLTLGQGELEAPAWDQSLDPVLQGCLEVDKPASEDNRGVQSERCWITRIHWAT